MYLPCASCADRSPCTAGTSRATLHCILRPDRRIRWRRPSDKDISTSAVASTTAGRGGGGTGRDSRASPGHTPGTNGFRRRCRIAPPRASRSRHTESPAANSFASIFIILQHVMQQSHKPTRALLCKIPSADAAADPYMQTDSKLGGCASFLLVQGCAGVLAPACTSSLPLPMPTKP